MQAGSGDGGPPGDAGPDESNPWTELTTPGIHVEGGAVFAAAGEGAGGGAIELRADLDLVIDPGLASPDPTLPAAPAGGAALDAGDLGADVSRSETIRVSGEIAASGAAPVRRITSTGGDIVIDGTLRGADLGGRGQGFELAAPDGTVFIAGAVRTAGDGDGSSAGPITITARHVVIDGGTLDAAGSAADGGSGGAGGRIFVQATGGSVLIGSGVIDASGGDGGTAGDGAELVIIAAGSVFADADVDISGGDGRGESAASGGAGGSVRVRAVDEVSIAERVRLRGGAAITQGGDAAGGAAGSFEIDTAGAVSVVAIVDGRGGPARAEAAGGNVDAGAGGRFRIPASASLALGGSLVLAGGAGVEAGGSGGALDISSAGGELRLAGPIDLRGGDAKGQPGAAGELTAQDGGGGISVAGEITGTGGAALPGGDADGGRGTNVWIEASLSGAIIIEATGRLLLDGGASAGTGTAGGGGVMEIRAVDGDATMAGELIARGGQAPDPGGTGGTGGRLHLWTDVDFDGLGGHITIEETGLIDVSGGPGTIGGYARNDGAPGVAYFPDGIEQIAVLLNSDSVDGELTDGVIDNRGKIIARGFQEDGWGGDVIFHGRQPDSSSDPMPGHIETAAHGAGQDGTFASQ